MDCMKLSAVTVRDLYSILHNKCVDELENQIVFLSVETNSVYVPLQVQIAKQWKEKTTLSLASGWNGLSVSCLDCKIHELHLKLQWPPPFPRFNCSLLWWICTTFPAKAAVEYKRQVLTLWHDAGVMVNLGRVSSTQVRRGTWVASAAWATWR